MNAEAPTVRRDWTKPTPPTPSAKAAFVDDGVGNFRLFWWVPEGDNPPPGVPALQWPFVGGEASASDLVQVGFIDVTDGAPTEQWEPDMPGAPDGEGL